MALEWWSLAFTRHPREARGLRGTSLRGLIFNYGVMYKRLILSGVLIYAFFNAIPYAIINSTASLPYMVHSVVNIIMNVLFALGIIWNHKYLYRRLR